MAFLLLLTPSKTRSETAQDEKVPHYAPNEDTIKNTAVVDRTTRTQLLDGLWWSPYYDEITLPQHKKFATVDDSLHVLWVNRVSLGTWNTASPLPVSIACDPPTEPDTIGTSRPQEMPQNASE